MSLSLKIISKKSSALMATLMILLGLSALIGFSSQQALCFLESQRTGSIDTTLTQFEENLIQSMQASYYEVYRSVSSDSSKSKIMTETDLKAVAQEGYARLGITGVVGEKVMIPHSTGNSIEALIQLKFPPSITQIDTQATTPYSPIQGTYSWLDGVSAIQKSIDLTLTLSGKNAYSGKVRAITHSYRLQLLEIPVENISLSSLGNITLPNVSIQARNGYFGGSLQGGNGIQFQNRLITGNREDSGVNPPSDEKSNRGEWSERGYSEIVSTNSIRNLSSQRSPALGTVLKASYLFREGLAAESRFSDIEKSQLRTFQPYYRVPVAQRIYGIHNPSATNDDDAFLLSSGDGEEESCTTLPSWATVRLNTNSTPKVQFLIDLSLISPDANQEVNLFIGSRNRASTGPFSQAEIIIIPWENIPSDRKITVISPNSIVISGVFNQGTPSASVHFFANRVYYGSSSTSQVHFEGTYSNYQQQETGSSLNFQSSDGALPESSTLLMNSNDSKNIHRNHHYYYLVLKSKIP